MVLQTINCINNFILYERDFTKNDRRALLSKKAESLMQKHASQKAILEYNTIREKEKLAKYNNKASIYSLKELNNSELLIHSFDYQLTCVALASQVKSYANSDLDKYQREIFPYESPLEITVHVKWDSVGKVIAYNVNSSKKIGKVRLDSGLNINPSISYGKLARSCFVEDDLTFKISYSILNQIRYEFKKTKTRYNFARNSNKENEPEIVSKLNNLILTQGNYYTLFLGKVVLSVSFIPLPDNNDFKVEKSLMIVSQ